MTESKIEIFYSIEEAMKNRPDNESQLVKIMKQKNGAVVEVWKWAKIVPRKK